MKAAIWTLYGVFWTAVMTLAVTAVWTSTNDDLSSRLGNTAGLLAGGVFAGAMVGYVVHLTLDDGDIW